MAESDACHGDHHHHEVAWVVAGGNHVVDGRYGYHSRMVARCGTAVVADGALVNHSVKR